MGALDANGVYEYDGADIVPAEGLDVLLNLLGGSISDLLGMTFQARTPVLSAVGGGPTLGTGGYVKARWVRLGDLIIDVGRFNFGSASTASGTGAYEIDLPVAARFATDEQFAVGSVWLNDASSGTGAIGVPILASSTKMRMRTTAEVGAASPWAWAASDQGRWIAVYEAA